HLAHERRRFGYRRLYVLLRREGHVVNRKRVYRLYREERLMVRRRGGRKRALGLRAPIALPSAVNERWSLDFVHDQMVDGRLFRSLPHARVVLEAWRQDYNAERPHSRLGWLTPHAYATSLQTSSSQRDRPLPLSGGSAACPVASTIETQFTQPRTLDPAG